MDQCLFSYNFVTIHTLKIEGHLVQCSSPDYASREQKSQRISAAGASGFPEALHDFGLSSSAGRAQ